MSRTDGVLEPGEVITVEELDQVPNNSTIYKDDNGSYQATPLGDFGQVLQSNGVTEAPSFEDPSGGGGGVSKTVTFLVTADFAQDEVIDITDGTGAISGTSTRTIGDTGDITRLGISANVFNVDASLSVVDNKSAALKSNDVIWDSNTTFHFIRPLLIGEWFQIKNSSLEGGGALGDTTVNGDLTVTGDITKTGSTVGTVIEYVDDSGGDSIINLPTAVGRLNQSFTYIRTDTSTNTTTLNPDGVETISNSASFVFGKGESPKIISDDSNWFIY